MFKPDVELLTEFGNINLLSVNKKTKILGGDSAELVSKPFPSAYLYVIRCGEHEIICTPTQLLKTGDNEYTPAHALNKYQFLYVYINGNLEPFQLDYKGLEKYEGRVYELKNTEYIINNFAVMSQ